MWTAMEFPDAPVRASLPEDGAVDVAALGTGPMVSAVASVRQGQGVIPQRIYAQADVAGFLDLTTLRHRGREVDVSAWVPVPPGSPILGATLRPIRLGGPDTVELTDFLPRLRGVA